MKRSLFLLLALISSTACVASAERSRFEVSIQRDLPSTVGMAILGAVVDNEKTTWNELTSCGRENRAPDDEERLFFETLEEAGGLCDTREVIWPDLWVTKMNWLPAERISDYGLLGMLALPYAISAVDTIANAERASNFGVDALVISQAYSATFLVGALLKIAARRPRPLTYNAAFGKAARFEGDARLSFPSGHTSMSFASASITSVLLLERYGLGVTTALGIGGAYLSAATVGVMRMAAGKHFLTDVLVGAGLGTFFGLVIPSLHLESTETDPDAAALRVSSPTLDRVYFQVVSLGGAW